jgi:Zn-dependent protease with chaperone function
MFSQFLYIIVALLLFTLQQPGREASFGPLTTVLLALGLMLAFVIGSYAALRRLRDDEKCRAIPPSVLSLLFHRVQARLQIAALVNVALYVYALNIKFYLQQIPGFQQSSTLSGAAGICLYLLHTSAIWFLTYPIHKRIHHSQTRLSAFVLGHISFISAMLIPWLFISIVMDLLQWLNTPAFLQTDLGELLILGTTLLLFVLLGPGIVVRLWGCETLPDTPLKRELEEFCREFRFKVADFKVWPLFGGEALTAAIIGILPRRRYILITRNLLTLLNGDELKAVVAHEMGHIRRYHLLLYFSFFICYSFLAYSLNDFILLMLLKQPILLRWALNPDTLHLSLFSITYSFPILILLIIYFRFIFGYFMRNCERQADIYAMQQVGHPYTLISSLEKIAIYSGAIRDLPSWHHYGIGQRIDFLLKASNDPAAVKKHNRKIFASVLLFYAAAAILIVWSTNLKDTRLLRNWQTELQLGIVENELQKEPVNMEYYAAYGGILLEMGRYNDAESALKNALRLAPHNPWIMNNLAWLYATSPPPYSNPVEAVQLASNAASLNADAQILDTLSEAYFANRQYELALETIRRALETHPKNEAYFMKQKERFKEALRKQHQRTEGG